MKELFFTKKKGDRLIFYSALINFCRVDNEAVYHEELEDLFLLVWGRVKSFVIETKVYLYAVKKEQ